MLLIVIATITLHPILPYLWKLLSIVGSILFGFVFTSWMVHVWFPPKFERFPDRKIQSLGDIRISTPRINDSLDKDKESRLAINLKQFLEEVLSSQLGHLSRAKPIVDMIKLPNLGAKSESIDTSGSSILDAALSIFSTQTANFVHSLKMQKLFESWSIMALEIVKDQIISYKKSRAQIRLASSSNALSSSSTHLDDFNEFKIESEDESRKWSSKLDILNEQVKLKMQLGGELHRAVGQGKDVEGEYLRRKIAELMDLINIENIPLLKNPIFKMLLREWVFAKAVWPLLNLACNPHTVNMMIIERSTKRIVVHRAVKFFKSQLDLFFSSFPPVFLIANNRRNSFSVPEKQRYVDEIFKYLRKATSELDITALKTGVLSEIRKKSSEINSIQNPEAKENLQRYLSSLKTVLRRIDKREKFLANKRKPNFVAVVEKVMKSGISKDVAPPSVNSQSHVTLGQILEKYAQSADEAGNIHSMSLYYFIDFLEKRKDRVSAMDMMKFWASTENFRKLVWRLGSGIVSGGSTSQTGVTTQSFSLDTHRRLQKEISTIYNDFIAVEPARVELPIETLDSILRYINAKNLQELEESFSDNGLLRAQKYVRGKIDALFDLFCNSNSYFQLSSELQKAKLASNDRTDVAKNSGNNSTLKAMEGSALMVALDKVLLLSCGYLYGNEIDHRTHDYEEPVLTLESATLHFGNMTTSTGKDEEEDIDEFEPTDHNLNTSKITELDQEIDRSLKEIDCMSILKAKLSIQGDQLKIADSESIPYIQQLLIDETVDFLRDEIGDFAHQKSKLESQERRDAIVPGQCIAQLREYECQLQNSKKVTFYDIDITRTSGTGSGWSVKRRYSDFDALHQKLKNEFEFVTHLELPAKTMMITAKSKEVRQARLKALEKYLQVLFFHLVPPR